MENGSRRRDLDGRVWQDAAAISVLFRVADLDWQPPPLANTERSLELEEYQQTYDWIVEAVDPLSGLVIASRRFRQILWGRPPSTVLVSHGPSDEQGSTFEVWRPVLQQRVK